MGKCNTSSHSSACYSHAEGYPWNFVMTVSPKTEILKKFDDVYKRFDTIPVCYRRTDGRNWNNNIALCMLRAIKSRLQTFSCICRRYPTTAANGNITQAADTAPLVAGAASGPRCFEACTVSISGVFYCVCRLHIYSCTLWPEHE